MISTAASRALRAAGLAALLLVAAAHAQEATVTRRAAELRESAGRSAPVVATLAPQTAVTRTGERRGPWVRVRTEAGQSGWVHLFDLGPASGSASAESGGGANPLRGLTGLFGGRSRQTASTTATGIRGLGAEDLANAQPDLDAVTRMEQLRQGEDEARRFAAHAALQAVDVQPLPAPPRPAAGSHHDPLYPAH